MEAFGYDENDKKFKNLLKLSQVTLNCKKEDLNKIIEFLNDVKNEIANAKIEDGDHWHYRDYNDSWQEKEPDLIIYIDNDTNK